MAVPFAGACNRQTASVNCNSCETQLTQGGRSWCQSTVISRSDGQESCYFPGGVRLRLGKKQALSEGCTVKPHTAAGGKQTQREHLQQ